MPDSSDQTPSPKPSSDAGGPLNLRFGARLFIRGFAMLMASQGVTWLSTAVITAALLRYLGPELLGKYAYVVAFMGLAELVADMGLATYLNRQVAREPAQASRLLTAAIGARLTLGLIVSVPLAIGVSLVSQDPVIRTTTYLLCVMVVTDAFGLGNATLNGLLQIKWIAVSQAASKLVLAAIAVVALRAGYGPPGAAFASLVGAMISSAVNLGALFRLVRPTLRLEFPLWRRLVVGGLPFFLMSAAIVIYSQIDIVLLHWLTDDTVVGWYSAGLRIIAIPAFAPMIVMTLTFPALAMAVDVRERFDHIARQAIRVTLLATIPISVGMLILPSQLIAFFGGHTDFTQSAGLVMLLAPGVPLVGVDMMLGSALIAFDKQRQWTAVGLAAAVLNPLANLAAIPYTQTHFGNGAVGAAAVTSLTELFMMGIGLRLLPPGVLNHSTLLGVLRIFVICLPMAAVAWLTRHEPLPVPVVAGGGVYVATCLVTRTISREDLASVMAHLLRRRQVSVESA